MTRSVGEIKRLSDQLEDNDVRLKIQTEVRRLVDKIELNFTSKRFVIRYHKLKVIYWLKPGKSAAFVESDAEWGEFPPS
jgi:hypothetical protein